MKDKVALPVPTEHRPAWRAEARALGWYEAELEGLASVLAIAKEPQRVVAVAAGTIVVWTRVTYVFEGVGRDNRSTRSEVVREGVWYWNHHITQRDAVHGDHDTTPWCPAHGYHCVPTTVGCGAMGIARLEFCGCRGRRHRPGCEVALQKRAWDAEHPNGLPEAPPPPRAPLPPQKPERRRDPHWRPGQLPMLPDPK